MKDVYAIQPYEVGTKNHKGLAIYIPSEVKKKCAIDKSSIFNLKIIKKANQILLYGPNSDAGIIDVDKSYNYTSRVNNNISRSLKEKRWTK